MIVKRLIELASNKITGRDIFIKDISVGLRYVIVQTNEGAGVSAVLDSSFVHDYKTEDLESLINAPVFNAFDFLLSNNPLSAAVGLASINAVLNVSAHIKSSIEGHFNELLSIKNTDIVGVVGGFYPIIPGLKSVARDVYVFERNPFFGIKNLYPDWAIKSLLPKCDVVIITATTLINKTIEDVLQYIRPDARTILLGPSTPLAPEVFKETGINLLGGVVVIAPESLKRIITLGGGTRGFGDTVKKVNLRVE